MNDPNIDLSTRIEDEPVQEALVPADKSINSEPPTVVESHLSATQSNISQPKLSRHSRREFLWLAATFAVGLGSGFALREWVPVFPVGSTPEAETNSKRTPTTSETVASVSQVSLPEAYTLPASYDDLGPRLLQAGAIEYGLFTQLYQEAGQPLTPEQLAILTADSGAPVVINRENAYFLLNFFWATGLVNQNPILTEGTIMQYGGQEKIGSFASTGGWTIGAKPAVELYASTPLFDLTSTQQARLEEVANAVYRPCCNNPTSFPDCNHGMAMLGVLELLVSQDVTTEEMFKAAKYLNAFWFPQQTYELALAFNQGKGLDFAEADARELVSANFSSSSGFQAIHQWLADNNLLQRPPGGGNNCGI